MNKYMLNLIVDHRESKLLKLLDQKQDSITYETKALDVGDVIVSEDVAIERKTGSDFISSIIDGRLFEQMLRLLDTYPNPVLILESFDYLALENTGMNLSSVYGALAYISYKLGVSVIPTVTTEDTLIVIERIAYREQIEDIKPTLARRAPKGMTIEERRAYALEGLIDTGPKKAQALIERFKTPLKVFEAIKDTEITYTKTGNPKGVEGPLQKLSGFGWKYVKKNKELLVGETD
ncbi:MAG: ERCC4 domain-containing protein [Candidatus Heimdallarchaeaceae archaeon]